MSNTVANGTITEGASVAQLEATQTPGSHVGTVNYLITLPYNGSLLSYAPGQTLIADPLLYGAITAAGAGNVTWSN